MAIYADGGAILTCSTSQVLPYVVRVMHLRRFLRKYNAGKKGNRNRSQLSGSRSDHNTQTTTNHNDSNQIDSYCNPLLLPLLSHSHGITMVKTKKHQQQKKNDQGGGNQQKKSKTFATANTNTDTNGSGTVWKAEEEFEIELLESRKTATGEIEGRVQWKDVDCVAVGETEWVVSVFVANLPSLLCLKEHNHGPSQQPTHNNTNLLTSPTSSISHSPISPGTTSTRSPRPRPPRGRRGRMRTRPGRCGRSGAGSSS